MPTWEVEDYMKEALSQQIWRGGCIVTRKRTTVREGALS